MQLIDTLAYYVAHALIRYSNISAARLYARLTGDELDKACWEWV